MFEVGGFSLDQCINNFKEVVLFVLALQLLKAVVMLCVVSQGS